MTSATSDSLRVLLHFLQAKLLRFRSRALLRAWQGMQLRRFLRRSLPGLPYYAQMRGRGMAALPIIDKQVMLTHFEQFNTAGIPLADATACALRAEATRDFRPELEGISVGLSSGTMGPRSAFMVSRRERLKWAGIMLARVLTPAMIRQLLMGRQPLKVAFFMRANSNLYDTLASRRIDFRFYDLLQGVEPHLAQLQEQAPDILVAPSKALGWIAGAQLDGRLKLAPVRVIAVAEVLEPEDRHLAEQAFSQSVHQLYQCTEGFLAYTCSHGVLHMNEEYLCVEQDWLDEQKTRFMPVITDFTRRTQHFIRYRLNDVLRVRQQPCPCGNAALALEAIEGRSDDILWLVATDSQTLCPLFPDAIRHAVAILPEAVPDYRIEQRGRLLHIATQGDDRLAYECIATALGQVAKRHGMRRPECVQSAFVSSAPYTKRRRIVCVSRADVSKPDCVADHV
ncbi:F390 synthetase-related protein [Herbaspirillum sp. NPDC087042]|uniref:F390 synthetase-related protein n=1 Tax=Herbaspirillum sp. NPDC087042 TaxID=3364004 RepID=UPI00382D6741